MEEVARVLKVPADAIKNLDEDAAINIISSTFNDNASVNKNCTVNINPFEKWIEALDDIKRLNAALLKEKDDKIALLEKLMDKN